MTRCYDCGVEQPTISAVCFKGNCQNEINLDDQIFCLAHQQSLEQQVTRLEKLADKLMLVTIKLEEWNELITNRHG